MPSYPPIANNPPSGLNWIVQIRSSRSTSTRIGYGGCQELECDREDCFCPCPPLQIWCRCNHPPPPPISSNRDSMPHSRSCPPAASHEWVRASASPSMWTHRRKWKRLTAAIENPGWIHHPEVASAPYPGCKRTGRHS